MIERTGSRTIYANRWMTVREDQVRRPDGSDGIYSVVEKPDFALIIPLDGDRLYLIEQYRYPIGARSWEFPQGTASDGSDVDAAELARAELAEETGLRAGRLDRLGRLYHAPGLTSQGFVVFLATDLQAGEPDRELEEQDLQQRRITRDEFERLILDGTIIDAPTIAAYSLLQLREQHARDHGAEPPLSSRRGREGPRTNPPAPAIRNS